MQMIRKETILTCAFSSKPYSYLANCWLNGYFSIHYGIICKMDLHKSRQPSCVSCVCDTACWSECVFRDVERDGQSCSISKSAQNLPVLLEHNTSLF